MKTRNSGEDRSLLIIAHGSRAKPANEEFLAFVSRLKAKLTHYKSVKGVFLELCEPSLEQAVQADLELGIDSFDVYPLFINGGKHVTKDIPSIVDTIRSNNRQLDIQLMTYFGASDLMAAAVQADICRQIGQ